MVALDTIHDYQIKYQKQLNEDREKQEEKYKVWQLKDGMNPTVKQLLWTVFFCTIAILYFLKKK